MDTWTIQPPPSMRRERPADAPTPSILTFDPEMPAPKTGISVWQMSDGHTALAYVFSDGTGALVGSDTDDVIFWSPWGDRYHFIDLPDSAVEYRSVWNVSEHAESALYMARRTLADWRLVLAGGEMPLLPKGMTRGPRSRRP